MTAKADSTSRIPECPDCGAKVDYVRIILHKPFPCPSCRRQVMVAEPYLKRFKWFCLSAAMFVALVVAHKFWIAAPLTDARLFEALLLLFLACYATLFVIMIFAGICVKRIFRPTLEDFEENQKKARYTAL